MIELLYFASQIQCGVDGDLLNIQVDVYKNQELVRILSVNERVFISVNSVNDLSFTYKIVNNTTQCSLSTPTEQTLAPNEPVPNISGAYEQQSIQTMLDGLNNYEELFLVELGTEDRSSITYDLQDVVFIVNNNPAIFPD